MLFIEKHTVGSHLHLLCSRLNTLSSFSLSSHVTCQSFKQLGGLPLLSCQYVVIPPILRSPKLGTGFQLWSHLCQAERKDHFLGSAGYILLKHPRKPMGFFTTRPHHCFMGNWLFTRNPLGFFLQTCFLDSQPQPV